MATERKREYTLVRDVRPTDTTVSFTMVKYDATGENPQELWSESFDYSGMPDDVNAYATAHGWNQKIGDKAALKTGATPEEKHAAIRSEIDRLNTERSWDALTKAAAPRKSVEEMFAELSDEALEQLMTARAAKLANRVG